MIGETHEEWDDIPTSGWYPWGERVQETGTAIFHVYCSEEHAERGDQCLDCLGVEGPWQVKHNAKLLTPDGLERTRKIGQVASYREVILRQNNKRRLTEQRSKR